MRALTLRIGFRSRSLSFLLLDWRFIRLDTGLQPVTKTKSNSHTTSTKCQYQATPLEGEVALRVKCLLGSAADHHQHDGAQGDVEAVEAGEHEEGGPIGAGAHGQTEFAVGVVVFVSLEAEEGEAQQRWRTGPGCCARLFSAAPVGPGDGDARGEEQGRIDGRDAPGTHGVNSDLGAAGGPGAGKVRIQGDAVGSDTMFPSSGTGNDPHVEQGTEEGGEEHHLEAMNQIMP